VDLAVGVLRQALQLLLARPLAVESGLESLGGYPGRDLSRLRATHPIGDREHRRPGEQGVFVRVSLPPGVGLLGVLGNPQHCPIYPATS
jgi:hypothetical protein